MKYTLIHLISAMPVFLMMTLVSPPASGAHYTFKQGFSGGGVITGSFDGEDTVSDPVFGSEGTGPDGLITACSGRQCYPYLDFNVEVKKFSIRFSGNSFFRKLDNLPDIFLNQLVYSIANNTLSIDFGTSDTTGDISKGFLSYSSDFGEILLFKESEVITATATESISVAVAQAPLPNALILFATGIVFLFVIVKRKTFPVINSKVKLF